MKIVFLHKLESFMALICLLLVTGCSEYEYVCNTSKDGLTLRNSFGFYSPSHAPFRRYGNFVSGQGSLRNDNDFELRVVQERRYMRMGNLPIDVFSIGAYSIRKLIFTGNEVFRVFTDKGVPYTVITANYYQTQNKRSGR